jgi:hypothetical protein
MIPWLSAHLFSGEGEIVELGTFIGASTVCFGSGLRMNESLSETEKAGRIHSFDRFSGEFETNWIKNKSNFALDSDGRFLGLFKKHTDEFREYVQLHDGDILNCEWSRSPIEILFVDIFKTADITGKVVQAFFPYLVPGLTIVVMQDYLFNVLPYSVVVMEHFRDYFVRCGDTHSNSVLFLLKERIPPAKISEFRWSRLPQEYKLNCLISAAAKQPFLHQREFIAAQISDFISGKHQ